MYAKLVISRIAVQDELPDDKLHDTQLWVASHQPQRTGGTCSVGIRGASAHHMCAVPCPAVQHGCGAAWLDACFLRHASLCGTESTCMHAECVRHRTGTQVFKGLLSAEGLPTCLQHCPDGVTSMSYHSTHSVAVKTVPRTAQSDDKPIYNTLPQASAVRTTMPIGAAPYCRIIDCTPEDAVPPVLDFIPSKGSKHLSKPQSSSLPRHWQCTIVLQPNHNLHSEDSAMA